jgi:hypothetical protein
MKNGATVDLIIHQFCDCRNFVIAIGSKITSECYQIQNQQFLTMLMFKSKFWRIAKNQGLSPHQLLLKAIYQSVEDCKLFPEETDQEADEKLYLLKLLTDLGRKFKLRKLISFETYDRLKAREKLRVSVVTESNINTS